MMPSVAQRSLIVAFAVPGTFPGERERTVYPEVLFVGEECAACHVHRVSGYCTYCLVQHVLQLSALYLVIYGSMQLVCQFLGLFLIQSSKGSHTLS